MRALKRIFTGTAFLLFLLILLLQIVNLNAYRKEAESAVASILEQPVEIRGDIKVGLLGWRPAVVLNKVATRDGKNGPVTTAERVSVSLMYLKSRQNFQVGLKGLAFEGEKVGDYDLPILVYDTGFDARDFRGRIDGADIRGDLSWVDDKFNLKLNLKDLPYERLTEGMKGKVKGNIELAGRGFELGEVLKTLKGNFTLVGGEGTMVNKSVNLWTRGLITGLLPRKDETKLNCALLDFKIENGVANSRAIVVDTDEVSITGKGSVDLVGQYVDIVLKPNPKDITLVSLATPMRMKGPMDNITVMPAAGGVVKKIGGFLLGAVNPAMVLLPLIQMGSLDDNNPCVKSASAPPKQTP